MGRMTRPESSMPQGLDESMNPREPGQLRSLRFPMHFSAEELVKWMFEQVELRYGHYRAHTASYAEIGRHLPLGFRVLGSTNWIEAEVSNGGFAQFFWNRRVDYALIAGNAIRPMG